MEWIDVYDAHTPYEWIVQVCLSIVDPWGDEREDLRSEAHGLAVIAQTHEAIDRMTDYLQIHEKRDAVGPATMRQMIEG